MMNWNRKTILSMTAMGTVIICMIIMFFFNPGVYGGIFSKAGSILAPFIYGGVIAYLLRPLSHSIERILRRLMGQKAVNSAESKTRMVAIILALIIMLCMLALLLSAVVPELVTSITELVRQLPDTARSLEAWLGTVLNDQAMEAIQGSLDQLMSYLEDFLGTTVLPQLSNIMVYMRTGFAGVLGVIKNFILGIIIAVYLLSSWEKFGLQMRMIIRAVFTEKAADWVQSELRFTDEKFSGFIFGKLVDSLIIGIICFIFCMITRMPYSMLISIIIGITNVIPFFGPYLGAVPSAVLILTISPIKCLIFVVFIIVLQQIDGNIIGPKILGDRLGLSAFWILFSILIFGSLFGVAGMLVGAPLFAVLYDIVRDAVLGALRRKGEDGLLEEYRKLEMHEGVPSDSLK